MGFWKKLFGDYSSRELKSIYPIADKIEALGDTYHAMSDQELQAKTPEFKARLANGETLDDILPEAFATVREAADRVLGLRPYRVQLIGGIVLHQGRIAEMKTGEGKTLVATLPAYLNALAGKGVHIVTVNDYLAKRDSEWMGKVHRFLGLSVGLIVHGLSTAQRQAAYAADITYGTNNEMGFDYLRDNMCIYARELVQRGHSFAIVDEVDSILIDEARTPLIISGQGEKSTQLYDKANDFVRALKKKVVAERDNKEMVSEDEDADYIVDEKAKSATLTARGIAKAEQFFQLENLADPANSTISHHINQALHAYGIMKRDSDYVVQPGKSGGDEVIIVDSFTGRLMYGRRYSNGLHQAIEAKEGVTVASENKTLATITFQNYFRMYDKLSGMTGTAMTEQEEFGSIYNLDIVEIPTNRDNQRVDYPDLVYRTEEGKLQAIVEQVKTCHEKGQPVLVGTVSVEKNEQLGRRLSKAGIPHNLLNAKNHEKEAEIIAQAGQPGAVTVATNMAGRGTDIILGGNAEYMAQIDLRKYMEAHPQEYVQTFQRKLSRLWHPLQEKLQKDFGQKKGERLFTNIVISRAVELVYSEATGYATTDDPGICKAREDYEKFLTHYKEEIRGRADEVRSLGGLFIIGTERHDSRRIDNQLRGRAGRQGDPGETRFFLSLEDDLMRLFGGERLRGMMEKVSEDDSVPIESKMVTKGIENAQTTKESKNFQARKSVLEYDDVMNKQRELIYDQRRQVLEGKDMRENILSMAHSAIARQVALSFGEETALDLAGFRALVRELQGQFFLSPDTTFDDLDEAAVRKMTQDELTEFFYKAALHKYEGIEAAAHELDVEEAKRREAIRAQAALDSSAETGVAPEEPEASNDADETDETDENENADIPDDNAGSENGIPTGGRMREKERSTMLRVVDEYWMDHIDAMDDLKQGIQLRAYANTDPIISYKQESLSMFEEMINAIQDTTAQRMFGYQPHREEAIRRERVAKVIAEQSTSVGNAVKKPTYRKKATIGPNDPCPCGSGEKFKKCRCAAYHPNLSGQAEEVRQVTVSAGPGREAKRRQEQKAKKLEKQEKQRQQAVVHHSNSKKKKKR